MKSYRGLGITPQSISRLNKFFKGIYFANYSYFQDFSQKMTADDFSMDCKQVYSLEYMFSADIRLSIFLAYFKQRLDLKYRSAKYILYAVMVAFGIDESTDMPIIDKMVLDFKP